MTTSVEYFNYTPQTPVATITAALNSFLVGIGSIQLHGADLRKNTDCGGVRISITYTSPGPTQHLAYSWTSPNAVPADALANAFFIANPSLRGVVILDASPLKRRQLYADSVIAIVAPAMWSSLGNQPQRMRIVVADADILAGATGLCSLVTEAGTLTTDKSEVKNTFDSTWTAGHAGWAALDPATGEWHGFSSCC